MTINSFIRQRKGTIHAHELEALAWLQVLSQPEREHALNDLYIFDVQSGETFCGIGRPVTHWFGVVEGLLKVSSDSAEGQTMTFVGVPPPVAGLAKARPLSAKPTATTSKPCAKAAWQACM